MNLAQLVFFIFEILGTVAFAISGAMVAVGKRMDIFGVLFLGVTTALGGGATRDVISGHIPGMFLDYTYITVAIFSSLMVFIFAFFAKNFYLQNTELIGKINNIIDAVGLGAFTVTGAKAAMDCGYGDNFLLTVFFGVLTGIGGGLLRDVFVREIPFVFTKRVYAVASIAGGCLYYLLYKIQFPPTVSIFIGVSAVFLIRICATIFKWNLPKAFR